MRYLLSLLPLLALAQPGPRPTHPNVKVASGTALCHAFAVDLDAGEKELPALMEDLQTRKISPEEAQKRAASWHKQLPDFTAPIAEEQPVTKTFELPGTPLKITVTVMFTDETMPVAVESLWLGVYVGDRAVDNALNEPGSAIAETAFSLDTYKLLAQPPKGCPKG